mgnify:CR=1 FL=1
MNLLNFVERELASMVLFHDSLLEASQFVNENVSMLGDNLSLCAMMVDWPDDGVVELVPLVC